MAEQAYPRVLAISCNPFSSGGSNGRVFGELFCNFPGDKLAQFFVSNELPDFPLCKNYYRITDREAKAAFLGKKAPGRVISPEEEATAPTASPAAGKPIAKNPLTRLLRDIIWNSGRWQSRAFYDWVDEFSPEVIVMMAGEASFIPRIAMKLAKKRQIPLVIFNTENYYFKNYNYMRGKGHPLASFVFRKNSKRVFRRLMKRSAKQIYNSEFLESLYRGGFHRAGEVIYQPSSLTPYPKKPHFEGRFSYMGNLGVGRHRPLAEIGEALQQINPAYYLDVYGKPPTPAVEQALAAAPGIRFHGLIPYTEVKRVMEASDLLFHAEAADPFYIKDLAAAFSTKISDSLLSGRPLVLYADGSIACTQYAERYGCAAVIKGREELVPVLRRLIENEELRDGLVARAVAVGEKNHNAAANSEKMRRILCEVTGKEA